MPKSEDKPDFTELEWIKLKEEIGSESLKPQGLLPKIKSKVQENPFIPIGLVGTTACLAYGIYSMRVGDTRRSQLMMRARVVAQGATVVAMLVGLGITALKKA